MSTPVGCNDAQAAAAPAGEELAVSCGVDDFMLSFSSDQWINPSVEDGIQPWQIGMHLNADGTPGARFGTAKMHIVDQDSSPDPINCLDDLSSDLNTLGRAVYSPSTRTLRDDLLERIALPVRTVIVDQVTLHQRLRGHGLGVFLTGKALQYVTCGVGLVALFPGPLERDDGTPYPQACQRLGAAWARIGFEPYRDGVWILDPATRTFRARVEAEYQRLLPQRWAFTLEETDDWGGEITDIAPVMNKRAPWSLPAQPTPLRGTSGAWPTARRRVHAWRKD